jgi:hypothetical protein
MRKIVLIWVLFILCGCGGGGGESQVLPLPQTQEQTLKFWVNDFTSSEPTPYQISAKKVAEGQHCYIYLEKGRILSSTAINTILRQFEDNIYPTEKSAYGNEPSPGVDGDPKVYLLLHKIRDGFNPSSSESFLGGYFNPADEYTLSSQNPNSNEKEILYLNINPDTRINTDGVEFFSIIAHEFQHLIYWEQKVHRLGIADPSWLRETIAESSRYFCGYGPDYSSVFGFEDDPDHSLTSYEQSFGYYGMVYLWAQYLTDHFGENDIFRRMIENDATGIASVNAALVSIPGNTKDFPAVFRDWAVAIFIGDGSSVAPLTGHPEWRYSSINTWPGTYRYNNGQNKVTLPGLFPSSRRNVAALQKLNPWGLAYYSYTPDSSEKTTGTVNWNSNGLLYAGTFVDANPSSLSVIFSMEPGTPYTFSSTGYLILSLPSSDSSVSSGGTIVQSDIAAADKGISAIPGDGIMQSPREVMDSMNQSPSFRKLVRETGQPRHVFADSYFFGREKVLKSKGLKPSF